MRSRCPGLVVGTLSLIAVSTLAGHVQSEEFQCRRGDLVRRIRAAIRQRCRPAALPGGLLEGPGKSGRAAGAVESRPRPRILRRQGARNGRRLAERGLELRWRRAARSCALPPSQDAAELDAIEPSEGSSREPAAPADAPPPPDDAADRIAPSEEILARKPAAPPQRTRAGRRCHEPNRAIRRTLPRTGRASCTAPAARRCCERRRHVRSGHSAGGAGSGHPPARGAGRGVVGAVQTGDDDAWRP